MEVVVRISDSKFDEFKNFIKKLNAEIISSYPDEVVVDSVEEVKKRVLEAEKRVKKGEYVSEKEFDIFIERLLDDNS